MISSQIIVGRVMSNPTSNPNKTAATLMVSVARNYKPEGEQYYPTDVFICKALSEARAKMILDKFIKGDIVIVSGRPQKSKDYVNSEGVEMKGEMELIIDHIDGPYVKREGNAPKTNNAGTVNTPPVPKSVPPIPNKTTPPPPSKGTPPPPTAPRTAPPRR